MMVVANWKVEEINNKIREMKKNATRETLLSNYMPDKMRDVNELKVWYNNNGLVMLKENAYTEEAFFVANEGEALIALLQMLPEKTMIECLYRERNGLLPICERAGFQLHATFERTTITYEENPYLIPAKGKRKLLQEYYDPDCGEYATVEDIQQLDVLHKQAFDIYGDDVFSFEEWNQIIQNKECMVYKENGSILSYFVWKVEGKKLYSNVSYNASAANILYNMERRVFEKCWEQGIRTLYFWVKRENIRAMNRVDREPIEGAKIGLPLYNDIMIKL